MSLRAHTYTRTSPSLTTVSSHTAGYFPPASSSTFPFSGVESKHQAQLANYKRDPARARTARRSRFSTLFVLNGRSLSHVVEEGHSDEDEKLKRRSVFRALGILYIGKSRSRTFLVYLVTALACYILVRPLLRPTPPSSTQPGVASAGAEARTHPTSKPLRSRSRIPNRAALPPGVVFRAFPDHPIERGLLKVDSGSQVHPIYQLIRDAREAWDLKVSKQSKTLKAAVAEYKRRYHQAPPRGFDKWWKYVV